MKRIFQALCSGVLALVLVSCQASHDPVPSPTDDKDEKPQKEASRLQPATYLRKISLHLRGQTPSLEEYQQLKEAVKNDTHETYLEGRIQYYLTTEEHAQKMVQRLEELFFLRSKGVIKKPNHNGEDDSSGSNPQTSYELNNSLSALFHDLAYRNLSWDSLLVGKEYKAYPKAEDFSSSLALGDLDFFAAVSNSGQWNQKKPMHLQFSPSDPRVAGALTTSRFFNRYVNTALNKNRKRAAAVFRIFLCDDMKAVVVDEKGNQDAILDRVFPDTSAHKKIVGSQLNDEARHGSDPACMKCHYKLDPMGQAFQLSGLTLSPSFSRGGLVFKNSQGKTIEAYGRGIGEVAEHITEQPEYLSCQVEHFWNWFIGSDVEMSDETETELIEAFEKRHRKTNDFIAYLFTRPEFGYASASSQSAKLESKAKAFLKNCNGCHRNQNQIPSFTDWPIGGTQNSHQVWLSRIRKSLGLESSGARRTMPPKNSAWQPEPEELKMMKTWFEKGDSHE